MTTTTTPPAPLRSPTGAYLRLRLRLLGRLLREIGAWRLLLLGLLGGTALGRALVLAAAHPLGRWAAPVLAVLALAAAHRARDDLRFLALGGPGFRHGLAAEYVLWLLPLAGVLAGLGAWGAAALALGLAPAVAALPPAAPGVASRYRARSWFRSEAFEWVSGQRAGGRWAWPALLALAVWQRASPLGPGAALVGWLLVLLGHYGTPEPVTMLALAAHGRGPGPLLRRRLALALGYAAGTAAPLLALLAAGPAGMAGAAAVAAFWLALVALLVLTKYAFYPNTLHIRSTQGLVLGVALSMFFHPAYPALLLVMAGGLVWQSRRRMREVLF